MSHSAFLVAYVSIRRKPYPVIEYVGLFSEAGPTCDLGRYRQFVVVSADGPSYMGAVKRLGELLRHRLEEYQWAIDLLPEKSLQALEVERSKA